MNDPFESFARSHNLLVERVAKLETSINEIVSLLTILSQQVLNHIESTKGDGK